MMLLGPENAIFTAETKLEVYRKYLGYEMTLFTTLTM